MCSLGALCGDAVCRGKGLQGGWTHVSAPVLKHTLPAVLLFGVEDAQAVLGLLVVLCIQAML